MGTPFSSKPTQLANQDLQAPRAEYVFTLPSQTLTAAASNLLLRDGRDLPLLLLLFNVAVTTLPAAIALHVFGVKAHLLGLLYMVANYVLYLQARAQQTGGSAPGPSNNCLEPTMEAAQLYMRTSDDTCWQMGGLFGSWPWQLVPHKPACLHFAEVHVDTALLRAPPAVQSRCEQQAPDTFSLYTKYTCRS
jgi:hypothetical protein